MRASAFEDGQAAGPGGGDFGEGREAAGVALDGDHVTGAFREEGAGQAAGAGADLQHVAGGEVAGAAGDLGGKVQIHQEVLPQRLARREAVRGDHLAQGRQAILREARGGARHATPGAAVSHAGPYDLRMTSIA